MSIDRWLLYLHILAAATWMGAGVTLVLLGIRSKQVGEELKLISQMEWVGSRIGGPAVIVTLVTGIAMVARTTAWHFTQGWVIGALVILGFLFLVGVGFHLPQYKRINAAVEAYGDNSAHVQQLVGRSFAAARFEVVLIAIAMVLMVFKPGM